MVFAQLPGRPAKTQLLRSAALQPLMPSLHGPELTLEALQVKPEPAPERLKSRQSLTGRWRWS